MAARKRSWRSTRLKAGNLFLKVLATGGIYVAGGVALGLLAQLREPRFMQAFSRKGRFTQLMERAPVHVITARAALIGAAYGLECRATKAFV